MNPGEMDPPGNGRHACRSAVVRGLGEIHQQVQPEVFMDRNGSPGARRAKGKLIMLHLELFHTSIQRPLAETGHDAKAQHTMGDQHLP